MLPSSAFLEMDEPPSRQIIRAGYSGYCRKQRICMRFHEILIYQNATSPSCFTVHQLIAEICILLLHRNFPSESRWYGRLKDYRFDPTRWCGASSCRRCSHPHHAAPATPMAKLRICPIVSQPKAM